MPGLGFEPSRRRYKGRMRPSHFAGQVERGTGIEPVSPVWKTGTLPIGQPLTNGARGATRTRSLRTTNAGFTHMNFTGWCPRTESNRALPRTKRVRRQLRFEGKVGAGGGIRTRGFHVGNVALCR